MIKVVGFYKSTITELAYEIENFMKKYEITREQIISLTYVAQYGEKALLMYEDNDN